MLYCTRNLENKQSENSLPIGGQITNTIKLYDRDAYASDFDAEVISCRKIKDPERIKKLKERALILETAPGLLSETDAFYEVILDQTLFFPEEGGQTCDRGVLMVGFSLILPVLDVQIDENGSDDAVIRHVLAQEVDPATRVHGIISFDYRFSNMQNHSGEHIFSGLVHKYFGYENVGFHLSDNEVTMDYNGKLTAADIEKLEIEANDWIRQNVPIECRYPDEKELDHMNYRSKKELTGPVRIVTIPGCDVCACCAPHVRSTAEIGLLKVISFMNYKGGVRLSILCGERAEADYRVKQKELDQISHLLKLPVLSLAGRVKDLMEEKARLQASLNEAEGKLLEQKILAIPSSERNPLLFTEISSANQIRRSVNQLMTDHSGISAIFFPKEKASEDHSAKEEDPSGEYSYIIGSGAKNRDLRELQKLLSQNFKARGGGQAAMIQGSLWASEKDLRKFWGSLQ